MPIFKAKLSDGRTVTLEGDHKPTEEEVLSAVQGYKPDKAPTPQSLEPDFETKLLRANSQVHMPSAFSSGLGDTVPISENPDWAFTQATTREPGQFLKSIPSDVMSVVGDVTSAGLNVPVRIERKIFGTPKEMVTTEDESGKKSISEREKPLPFQQGKPIVQFQRTALQPEGNQLQRLVEGSATPELMATFPFIAAKPVQALFLAQTAPAAIESAKKLVSKDTPPNQRQEAATDLLINGLISYGLTKGLIKSTPTPTEVQDASRIESAKPVSQLEVRPSVGEEAPLRQQPQELAQARESVRQEPQQGTEVPQEKVVATPLTPAEQAIEQARLAGSEQGVKTEPEVVLAKEPWQMTKKEYEDYFRSTAKLGFTKKRVEDARKAEIVSALKEGDKIPDEVLADYPDLANKPPKPSVSGATPSPVLPEGTLEKAGKATTLPAPSISVTPKTGKTQVPLEILNSAKQVKVTAPKSATMVRVTDSKGKTATQSLASVQGENVFQGAGITKIEAGIIGKDKKFKPVKGEVTVEDKTPIVTTPLSRGPGAAAAGEPGTYSPIQRMADELRVTADKSEPVDSQISAIQTAKNKLSGFKDVFVKSLSSLKAIKDAMWEKWKGLPEYGDEQRAVGKWFRALQQADHEARNFAKAITAEVPNKLRREAITNWIQAEGNEVLLRDRAAASKGSIKTGYELATKLTEREKQIAVMLRDYYDQQLQNGIQAGILKDGLENYITQVWKRENPVTKKLISELSYSKLSPNFKYARKRIFDSYFEGEQSGFKPNKDAGFLVANYDQAFNKSLAARAFIKDLHEGKASDGRPLVEISGNGKLVDEGEANPTVLINPHAKPEEISDYRTIDHPALRGWKWATKTPDGKNVFVKGDMLVHPEAYQKLKNRLSVSAFRQNPITRGFMRGQTTIKQTMLSVSGFHQVQETLHALGHRVNPANLPEIDFSEPVTKALAEHGLQLSDYNALDSFSEGLAGGSLTSKIPIVGSKLHAYNEWLFQDYIPRLKLQMAKLALERNAERYPKLSQDKLLELTAKEANAAFGELPYRYWGRSPTLQDALRAFILAPDFLEARTRFVGRALRPYGREQLVALGILAATQYITARIVNQIVDDDPHFETKNTFRIVAGNHAYGLRTIPADLIHLFSDSRGFFYNRMSPMLRTAFEAVSGRDDRGVKKDVLEQAKDFAKMPIPISIKPRLGNRWWETFLNAFGIQEQRYDAVQNIRQKSAEFKRQNNIVDANETIYNAEKDPYESLKIAIQEGDRTVAKSQFDKLKATIPQAKILLHFKDSLNRPFTGSKANDIKFYNSLDEEGKRQFQEAKDLNNARLKMVQSLAGRESSW